MGKRKKSKLKQSWFYLFIFNGQVFPIIISTVTLCILFVLFRMKGIEQDYRFNELRKKLDKYSIIEKELRAIKAENMSVKKLREFAKKFNLKNPDQNHIIVIPN